MAIILVTGANKGIGFAIVKQLAKEGHQVILTSRNIERGKKARDLLASQDLQVDFCQLDVTDQDSVGQCLSHVQDKYGALDVLINNAGVLVHEHDATIASVDPTTVEVTFEVNVVGPFRVTQAFLPLLKKSQDGRVVNLSSGLGQLNDPMGGMPAYSASKSALNAFTVRLAQECPSLKVNCMCPGWVKTDMGGHNAPRTPEQGADTAVWLATGDVTSGKFFRDRQEIDW